METLRNSWRCFDGALLTRRSASRVRGHASGQEGRVVNVEPEDLRPLVSSPWGCSVSQCEDDALPDETKLDPAPGNRSSWLRGRGAGGPPSTAPDPMGLTSHEEPSFRAVGSVTAAPRRGTALALRGNRSRRPRSERKPCIETCTARPGCASSGPSRSFCHCPRPRRPCRSSPRCSTTRPDPGRAGVDVPLPESADSGRRARAPYGDGVRR